MGNWLVMMVALLAARDFVYVRSKGKYNEFNAVECKKAFEN